MGMRFALTAAAALLALGVRVSFGSSSIAISDLTDGPPLVVTNIPGASVGTSPEGATISGTLTAPPGTALMTPGTRSVALSEPSSDPFNQPLSDVATLFADQVQTQLGTNGQIIGLSQAFRLTFQSDDTSSVTAPAGTPTLLEDGTPQDVSTAIGSSPGFTLTLQSDLFTPETPLPMAAWGGLALLGIVCALRIRRRPKPQID